MGLDMYLSRETYVKNWNYDGAARYDVTVTKDGVPLDLGNVSVIRSEAAYWRKANAIHDWFVQNVQDGHDNCASYEVRTETLQELVDLCKQVLANRELAATHLPPAEGFFFGSTDIDEYYFEDLEYTVEVLEQELAKDTADSWFVYQSSW